MCILVTATPLLPLHHLTYIHTYTRMYINTHICIHTFAYRRALSTSTPPYIYTRIYVYVHKYSYMHTYI